MVTKCYVGDWFVLCQLAKNCNPYFFREFVRELARELKTRPKKSAKSRSNSNAGTLKKQKSIKECDPLFENGTIEDLP